MHQVLANYTLPAILNTLQPALTSGLKGTLSARAGASPTTGTATSSNPAGTLGTTFLNLLSTELQNQDPTAPVDSTAMVGQMISLNQLDQLISINQTLTASAGTTGSPKPGTTPAIGDLPTSANGGIPATLSPSVAAAAASQLPFDPNTMMPLNSGYAGASATAHPSISAASLGSSSTNNNNSGGK
jgi:flagellar basal-body rod modification protein FlgD